MRIILTEDTTSCAIATIRTIAKPQHIECFDDMADFRLLMKKPLSEPNQGFLPIHFQFDMKVPPTADKKKAEEHALEIYRAVLAHVGSVEFKKRYGRLEIYKEASGSKPQLVRLKDALQRITQYYNMASSIKAAREVKGACIIEARLGRGVNIRCIDKRLTAEIEAATRPVNGTVTLSNRQYVFYLWRPNAVSLLDVSADVFCNEFYSEIRTSFPFLGVSEFDMQFDLMPEQAFIALDH
jgi:hypothetical protein